MITILLSTEDLTKVHLIPNHFGPVSPKKEHMLEVYLGDPDDSLKRLVNALRRYHDLTIAPTWVWI